VALRLLDQLNTFNLTGRRSRATQERKFTEERMLEVGAELRAAESRLEQFLEANREYRLSPKLTLQQDRLSRDVGMRQQVYSSLAQSYEQAKIDEVRDLPVITTVSEPEAPVLPDPRGLLLRTLFAMVAGAGLGLAIGFLREWRARGRLAA
jgi:tyrosine-protein kinase Etk/Wzc